MPVVYSTALWEAQPFCLLPVLGNTWILILTAERICSDVLIILQSFLSKMSVQTVRLLTVLMFLLSCVDSSYVLRTSSLSESTETLPPAPWHTSPFAEDCLSKCKSFVLTKSNLSCFSWYDSYFLVQPRKLLPKSRMQIFFCHTLASGLVVLALIFESLIPSGLNFLYHVRRGLIFIFFAQECKNLRICHYI